MQVLRETVYHYFFSTAQCTTAAGSTLLPAAAAKRGHLSVSTVNKREENRFQICSGV